MFLSKSKWDNPKRSIGGHYCNVRMRFNMRLYLCWEPIGPAQSLWRDVLRSEVDQFLPKSGQTFPKPIGETIYIIESNESRARPIIFFCGENDLRQIATKTIQDSGLLEWSNHKGRELYHPKLATTFNNTNRRVYGWIPHMRCVYAFGEIERSANIYSAQRRYPTSGCIFAKIHFRWYCLIWRAILLSHCGSCYWR